jgi:hypothetical protein
MLDDSDNSFIDVNKLYLPLPEQPTHEKCAFTPLNNVTRYADSQDMLSSIYS